MNNEFVSYEMALALKELGFDEPCICGYNDYHLLRSKISSSFDGDFVKWDEKYDKDLKAPLYQQAFRFFREKYNIQGYIYSSAVRGNAEKTKQFTGYIWNINGIDMPFLSTDARDELHDTYEEAELACLIKLIELIKNK